jgi:hypothetical protein
MSSLKGAESFENQEPESMFCRSSFVSIKLLIKCPGRNARRLSLHSHAGSGRRAWARMWRRLGAHSPPFQPFNGGAAG